MLCEHSTLAHNSCNSMPPNIILSLAPTPMPPLSTLVRALPYGPHPVPLHCQAASPPFETQQQWRKTHLEPLVEGGILGVGREVALEEQPHGVTLHPQHWLHPDEHVANLQKGHTRSGEERGNELGSLHMRAQGAVPYFVFLRKQGRSLRAGLAPTRPGCQSATRLPGG